MKPMKTIPLAEIFQLLIHLQKLFMTDFYSLECHEVYINTTLVLLLLVHSLHKTRALFILICKNDQFCFIGFLKKPRGKKHTFSIMVDNVTKQLDSSHTLCGSLVKMSMVISVKHSQIAARR